MGEDGPAKDETRAAIAYVFDLVLKMLHPFMPYLTEELWAVKGAEGPKRETILALASWPSDFIFTDEEAEGEIGWLVDLVTAIRSARNETNVPPGAQIPLVLVKASTGTHTRVAVWGDMLKRLARLSEVSFSDASPPESIGLVVHGESAALPLAGVVDIAAERARLTKEIEKNRGEITKIDAKLGNADFMKRAPDEYGEQERVLARFLRHQRVAGDLTQMRNVDGCHRISTGYHDLVARHHAGQGFARLERGKGAFEPF
jgi:valyl-tRNA synthetase